VTVRVTAWPQPHRHASYRHGPNSLFQLAVSPRMHGGALPAGCDGHRQGTAPRRNSPPTPRWPLLLSALGGRVPSRVYRASKSKPPRRIGRSLLASGRPYCCFMRRWRNRADAPGAEGPQRNAARHTIAHLRISALPSRQPCARPKARGGDPFRHDAGHDRPWSGSGAGEMRWRRNDLGGDMGLPRPRPAADSRPLYQPGGGRATMPPWRSSHVIRAKIHIATPAEAAAAATGLGCPAVCFAHHRR